MVMAMETGMRMGMGMEMEMEMEMRIGMEIRIWIWMGMGMGMGMEMVLMKIPSHVLFVYMTGFTTHDMCMGLFCDRDDLRVLGKQYHGTLHRHRYHLSRFVYA